ncbi:MAG: hypothetical protein HY909_23650 [Deltaproteobacteria bacterium]|nr:hypothetical protein [Deltaproteobacteria bacterium]
MARLPLGPALRVRFNRRLSPRSVNRATVSVTSGGLSVFGGVRYDPVLRDVWYQPNPGELRQGLEYVLTVRSTVTSWDGVLLGRDHEVHFIPQGRAGDPPLPQGSLARDIAPLFLVRCVDAGCHGSVAPALGLDLSSPEAIRRTAVGVAARQRPAPGPAGVTVTDPHWGPLARVDPGVTAGQGRPEYSYLLYKLLGDGPVVGSRMPLGREPLAEAELSRVSSWIAAGAPP